MRVRTDAPLAPLTTIRLGGAAASLVDVSSEDDLVEALRAAEGAAAPVFVLGGGSNVVVADEGFPGAVLRVGIRGLSARRESGRVVVDVGAGEDWDALVARAVDEGWGGVACMSGIPGLVGATPIQNVGAYGQEVGDTIASVRAYDRARGEFVDLDAADCRFAYRTSVFRGSGRFIVTGVRFAFEAGRDVTVRYAELARALSVALEGCAPAREVRDAVVALRRAKGMVVDPSDPESVSAGSFFVNPIVDARGVLDIGRRAGAPPPHFDAGEGRYKVAAAWLVERAGFARGWTQGRVGVSAKHALALVNRGGATTRELLGAARAIRRAVRERFGVTLEPEPVLVGCSWEEDDL